MHSELFASAAARNRGRLGLVLALTLSYVVVEFLGALLTNSLALLADAGHMLSDALVWSVALVAIQAARRLPSPERTYGSYRLEILAALGNAVILLGLCVFILYQAWVRLQQVPEVQTIPMLVVATAGIGVNLVQAALLHGPAQFSLNMRGAFLEAVSDLTASIGVVLAGIVMLLTGWYYADLLVSVLIGVFIVPRALHLLNEAVSVLLEGTPAKLDLQRVREALEAVPAVDSVHDLHVWSITSGYLALTAHARLVASADSMQTLTELHRIVKEEFEIDHSTIQLEEAGYEEAPTHA